MRLFTISAVIKNIENVDIEKEIGIFGFWIVILIRRFITKFYKYLIKLSILLASCSKKIDDILPQ